MLCTFELKAVSRLSIFIAKIAADTLFAVVHGKPRIIHDCDAIHTLALGQCVGQAIMVKMNGGKASPLLVLFGRKKSFVFEVGNLIVCFELDVA